MRMAFFALSTIINHVTRSEAIANCAYSLCKMVVHSLRLPRFARNDKFFYSFLKLFTFPLKESSLQRDTE
jgi:hypothetical protein